MSPVPYSASASASFRRSPARTLSLIGTRRGSSVWNGCETGIAIDDTAGGDGSHSRRVGKILIMKAHTRVGRKRIKRIRPTPDYVPGNPIDGFAQKEQELRIKFPSIDGDEIARLVAEERRKPERGLIPDLDRL